jgi:hypothetical protein
MTRTIRPSRLILFAALAGVLCSFYVDEFKAIERTYREAK